MNMIMDMQYVGLLGFAKETAAHPGKGHAHACMHVNACQCMHACIDMREHA